MPTIFKRLKLYIFILILSTLIFFIGRELLAPPRPHLTVIGYAQMADGIGRQTVELINALYDSVSIGVLPYKRSRLEGVPKPIQALLKKPNKKLGKIVIYEPAMPTPGPKAEARVKRKLQRPKNDKEIRIAYSMLESSRIPSQWAELLNKYFDAVAVPDPFLQEVYRTSGVEIPIFVLPLGLDMSSFLNQPLKKKRNVPFCFVNVSSMIPRKNHEGLIRAFYRAFGNDPNVQLHMNYRSGSMTLTGKIQELIASLNMQNIFLTGKRLNAKDYLDFVSKGDAFVSLAKGEGFSIQPREAMALGLPVIISNNTAHKTIIESGLACAVSCPRSEDAYNFYLKCTCGEEYLADEVEAAALLRDVYENYERYLAGAEKRREWAAHYTFDHLKPLYRSLVAPKQVILGDRDEITEEYVMTSSNELYLKYKKVLEL